jgi:hypothetical protein
MGAILRVRAIARLDPVFDHELTLRHGSARTDAHRDLPASRPSAAAEDPRPWVRSEWQARAPAVAKVTAPPVGPGLRAAGACRWTSRRLRPPGCRPLDPRFRGQCPPRSARPIRVVGCDVRHAPRARSALPRARSPHSAAQSALPRARSATLGALDPRCRLRRRPRSAAPGARRRVFVEHLGLTSARPRWPSSGARNRMAGRA